MATINPGGTKTRRKRRKLSAWQRAVKKHGGVQAAVKARRKKKWKSRVRKVKKFLRKVRRKIGLNGKKTRRSAGKRGIALRSRPRRVQRRSKMARKTRRRRLRGPGGRFLSRRRKGGSTRRRRARRNSWFGQPRRHAKASRLGHGRRRRRSRNPWTSFRIRRFRSGASGQFTGRKAPRRRYKNNAVVPVSWNPPKRRRYRRNSVLPVSWNPGGSLSIGGVFGRAKSFVDIGFWTDTALPLAGGIVGTKLAGSFLSGFIEKATATMALPDIAKKVIRIAADVLGASVLSMLVTNFLGKKRGDAVFMGGVASIAHTVLGQALGGTDIGRTLGLSGLGNDLTDKMRNAVAQRVEAELSGLNGGVGTYVTQNALRQQSMDGVGEFVTDVELRRQNGYAPTPGGDLRDYDVNSTETNL
jgi:hypothetical protein